MITSTWGQLGNPGYCCPSASRSWNAFGSWGGGNQSPPWLNFHNLPVNSQFANLKMAIDFVDLAMTPKVWLVSFEDTVDGRQRVIRDDQQLIQRWCQHPTSSRLSILLLVVRTGFRWPIHSSCGRSRFVIATFKWILGTKKGGTPGNI